MNNLRDIVDNSTCWYDKDLYTSVNSITAKEPDLIEVKHGSVLKELFDLIPMSEKTVLDIGCGNAKAHTLIGARQYTGLDLPNNVDTIGKVNYSELDFIKCDIIFEDNLSFINDYDIILMNAFIDVMEFPFAVLHKVLKEAKNYVIIHRQEIINSETEIKVNPSYTGVTYHTLLHRGAFNMILDDCGFEITHEIDAGFGGNWRSFLLQNGIC